MGVSARPASAPQSTNAPAAHEHLAEPPSSKVAGDKSPAAARDRHWAVSAAGEVTDATRVDLR
jgi:hypothetical protein